MLVVDDNRDASETMSMLLGLWGHEVRTAADGPSALEAAASQPPDVVLLDISLPGMSGYDVAERVRANPALQSAILVAMTGHGQAEDKKETRAAGFAYHLVKPVEPNVLQKLLAQIAAGKGAAT